MKLTYRQKHNLGVLAMWIIGVCIAGGVSCLLILLVNSMSTQPAQAVPSPPAAPQVNSSDYTQINTANDGTIDRYCEGHDGMYFSQNIDAFSVTANDPACK